MTSKQVTHTHVINMTMPVISFVSFYILGSSDLGHQLVDSHSSMLEELVFWMIKWEFPQSIVTLLLGLLPDDTYKVSDFAWS